SLDGENLLNEMPEEHRLISRARSHFEYALAAGQRQQLQIACMDRRLRDRLAVADRQGAVLVRAVPKSRRNEVMPWRLLESVQHCEIPNPTLAQRLDQAKPRATKLLIYGSR